MPSEVHGPSVSCGDPISINPYHKVQWDTPKYNEWTRGVIVLTKWAKVVLVSMDLLYMILKGIDAMRAICSRA